MRAALSTLLRVRLGGVPASIAALIDGCADAERLLHWIEQVGGASDVAAISALFRSDE